MVFQLIVLGESSDDIKSEPVQLSSSNTGWISGFAFIYFQLQSIACVRLSTSPNFEPPFYGFLRHVLLSMMAAFALDHCLVNTNILLGFVHPCRISIDKVDHSSHFVQWIIVWIMLIEDSLVII